MAEVHVRVQLLRYVGLRQLPAPRSAGARLGGPARRGCDQGELGERPRRLGWRTSYVDHLGDAWGEARRWLPVRELGGGGEPVEESQSVGPV